MGPYRLLDKCVHILGSAVPSVFMHISDMLAVCFLIKMLLICFICKSMPQSDRHEKLHVLLKGLYALFGFTLISLISTLSVMTV